MSANTSASFLFFSTFLMLVSATASFGQEFDWNDDSLQGRNIQPGNSGTYADRGLPGVRKNPYANLQNNNECLAPSLSGLATSQIRTPSDCDGGRFVIFSVPTETLNGGSSK